MTVSNDLPDWITSISGPTQQVFAGVVATDHIPVAQFNSVMIRIDPQAGAAPAVLRATFLNVDGLEIDGSNLVGDDVNGHMAWELPVTGPTLVLENLSANALIARVTGRPVQRSKRTLFDYAPYRKFSASVPNAAPSLTVTQLPGTGPSLDTPIPNVSAYNGLVTYVFTAPTVAGVTAWRLRVGTRRLDGSAITDLMLEVTPGTTTTITAGHPQGYVTWYTQNVGATGASSTVTLLIVPAESS